MKLGSGKAWAKTLGGLAAHLQHGIDKGVEFGFVKLKEAGKKPAKKAAPKNKYVRGAVTGGKSAVTFLGQLGEDYYKKYEELKKK